MLGRAIAFQNVPLSRQEGGGMQTTQEKKMEGAEASVAQTSSYLVMQLPLCFHLPALFYACALLLKAKCHNIC